MKGWLIGFAVVDVREVAEEGLGNLYSLSFKTMVFAACVVIC